MSPLLVLDRLFGDDDIQAKIFEREPMAFEPRPFALCSLLRAPDDRHPFREVRRASECAGGACCLGRAMRPHSFSFQSDANMSNKAQQRATLTGQLDQTWARHHIIPR